MTTKLGVIVLAGHDNGGTYQYTLSTLQALRHTTGFAVTLYGDPEKPSALYIYINKFKPNRFGGPHFHPNDRIITVIDGAGWKGTGPVVDPAGAIRLPRIVMSPPL